MMQQPESRSFAGILKRSAIGAALIVGLAGGTVGTALVPSVSAQDPVNGGVVDVAGASIADVVERVNPAVVTITNLQEQVNPFSGQATSDEPVAVGSGSGFIISEDGYVVTNYHVTDGGSAFEVIFMDGTVVPATFVGGDELQDVAVLKLELDAGQTVPATVAFGDAEDVRAGDDVIAIGSPYGEFTNSATTGIVNATDRSLDTGAGYALPNLIQHDADIYPGNSGGPLLNADGEVIGMNVAKATYTNGMSDSDSIGFAISVDAVEAIVSEIIADGLYDRAYLGVQAQAVASSRNPNQIAGQQIVAVVEDSPADAAGLQEGDIVIAVDGTELDRNNYFVNLVVLENVPGDTVTLTVVRDGDELDLDVTLGERPADFGA